ncbi:MAG: hypothetical protein GX616_27550 [Planctomycetes bacterium]|nr:hypothetical protein [Planctomycetota bacterium]
MKRRDFCAGTASLLAFAAGGAVGQPRRSTTLPAEADPDPAGGYTLRPAREFLFTDYRHIDPGDLRWLSPEGASLPVAGPPEPPVQAHADAQRVALGISLVAQKPAKQGPIEGLPGRVLHDAGLYRSWSTRVDYGQGENLGSYSSAPAKSLTVSYGESKDGFAWNWREACQVKLSDVTGVDGEYFFIDPHGPADERYKCIYNAGILSGGDELWQQYRQTHPRHRDTRLGPERMFGLFGMVSPDGLQWKTIPKPLFIHMGDTDNTVYYDEWIGKYVLYTRLYWMSRRMVARAESDDFHHWGPVEPTLWPSLEDPLSWDIYTNGRSCYPGLPEHHLMFPVFYHRLTQTSEAHLHSSVDGIHWNRVPGGPVLQSGEPTAWDSGFLITGKGMVPLGNDRVAIPYMAFDHPHKYPRWPGVISSRTAWATWPRGRLVALSAEGEGRFRTFPVRVTGRRLRLNVRVRRAGEIRVGLAGIAGHAIAECDPIFGDHLDRVITWDGGEGLGLEPGAKVILQFQMRSAELFGFEWL